MFRDADAREGGRCRDDGFMARAAGPSVCLRCAAVEVRAE